MRPAGRGELDSLYFDYPTFPAPEPGPHLTRPAPVAIVGAGPVGMTAALILARHGVRSVLLDAKPTFNDGSRAICIARASFHILEAAGVAERFLERALPWVSGRSFFRGDQILEFFMPDSAQEKFRPMYNLQQQYIEACLADAIALEPLIDLRWQSRVTGLTDREDGIDLSVSDPNGDYVLRAGWVLAADGARSFVRRHRGLRLKGDNYEGRYVIADIRIRHPRKTERWALFDPDSRPGGTVLVHQQPGDIWRVDYQLRDGEDETAALSEESIRQSVAGVLADLDIDTPWELEWWSIYSAYTLALDDYRDGRVFFIGDAAHIVPIFGVRGLNNGFADAHNIAWKLARVLNGQADAALLDSYTPERRGATMDVFANAAPATRFMTPETRGQKLMRDAALTLARDHGFAGQFANPRNMVPYDYAESGLTTPDSASFRAGPTPGAVARNVDLGDGFLTDGFGDGFTVLAFGEVPGLGDLPADVKVARHPADGRVAEVYGAEDGDAWLFRPDLHVAGRWRGATLARVQQGLDRAHGKGGRSS